MAKAGRLVSLTLTWKLQLAVLPLLLVAVQVTVVAPSGKLEPLGGWQKTVTPGQLSVPVATKVTIWPQVAGFTLVEMFPGQLIAGGSMSFTVTVKVQALVLPAASVAVHVTVVMPLLKLVPLAGEQLTLALGQFSVKLGV